MLGYGTQDNMGTTLNVDNTTGNNFNNTNNATPNVTTEKKGFLSRINKKKDKEEEEMQLIQKNIDNSLKVNVNDIVNPLEMNIKNSLFFRLHVSGLIESANVNRYVKIF